MTTEEFEEATIQTKMKCGISEQALRFQQECRRRDKEQAGRFVCRGSIVRQLQRELGMTINGMQ